MAFITSNSWLQTQYGQALRRYFIVQTNPLVLLNFANTQLFETAIVETNILLSQKSPYQRQLQVCVLDQSYHPDTPLADYVARQAYLQTDLPDTGWSTGNQATAALKCKMETNGKKLVEWNTRIDYGIKTGYNPAFIIDEATKNRLIAQEPHAADIIKPTLRGRDLKRYSYTFGNQWIICTLPSKKIEIGKYPVLESYFFSFGKDRLEQSGNEGSRKKTGNKWFETQDQIAYWPLFEQPKIIWGELSDEAKFTFDAEGHYVEATTFMMTGESLKYLLAVLNSRAAQWYFEQITTTSGMGTNRWKKYKIEQLPVPVPTPEEESQIEALVNQTLSLKKEGKDTAALEAEIDRLVYELYRLTENEIAVVEERK